MSHFSNRIRRSGLAVLLAVLFLLQLAAAQTRTPVLLVSIDGFRHDYLVNKAYDALNLRALAKEGVASDGLIPSFPSKTFPNHYTIATGLYPAHSGIIGNRMVDPVTKEVFSMGNRAAVQDAKWWGGEPIWVTAAKQGCPAAPLFWPGSEAPIGGQHPKHWLPYDDAMPHSERIAHVLDWLTEADPVCFATLYFNEVDTAGHHFGPESQQVKDAVRMVDHSIGELVAGLKQKGLWGKVNLIIVSDHGMASTPASQRIALDDYVDESTYEFIDGSPVFVLNAKNGDNAALVAKLNQAPHLHAYLAKDVPARWHFSGNPRIGGVVAVAEEGWSFETRERMGRWKDPHLGNHGFENDLESMRAIFIADGPGFQEPATLPPFPNVDIYSLMARLLNLTPAPNDGKVDVFLPVLKK
ncbi:MAG: ectonucleotide pyrophosphatase/phosphodiesterase [Acidobacteriota bacterium]|nr:ectonucleotide pyrophosphatase/phosphodiesterase [Acidobacteriota bacterium]